MPTQPQPIIAVTLLLLLMSITNACTSSKPNEPENKKQISNGKTTINSPISASKALDPDPEQSYEQHPKYDEVAAEKLIAMKIAEAEKVTKYYANLDSTAENKRNQREQILEAALNQSEKNEEPFEQRIAHMSALADFYTEQGTYPKVIALEEQILKIREDNLGKESPEVLLSIDKIIKLPGQAHLDYKRRKELVTRSLEFREKASNKNDPDLAETLWELAYINHWEGEYEVDAPLFKRALSIWKNILKKDPSNVRALLGCQEIYAELELDSKAKTYFWQALEAIRKKHGRNSPEEATQLGYSGCFPCRQHKRLLEKALSIEEKLYGRESLEAASTLILLGSLERLIRQFEHPTEFKRTLAKPFYQRSFKIRKNALPPNHPDTADALFEIASCDFFEDKYAEAEPLYWLAINMDIKTYGLKSPRVAYKLEQGPCLLYHTRKRWAYYQLLDEFAQKYAQKTPAPARPPKYDL